MVKLNELQQFHIVLYSDTTDMSAHKSQLKLEWLSSQVNSAWPEQSFWVRLD